jgi:hypothetical protein
MLSIFQFVIYLKEYNEKIVYLSTTDMSLYTGNFSAYFCHKSAA